MAQVIKMKTAPRSFVPPDDVEHMAEAKLNESAIGMVTAGKLGITTMTADDTVKLGLWSRWRLPALRLAYIDPRTGKDTGFARYRALRTPQPAPPKFPKYRQLPGTGVEAYFPHWHAVKWGAILDNPAQDLIITEGELKASCACLFGFPTIGLGGVWSFTAMDKDGRRRLLEALASIVWRGRRVFIIFDADVKDEVNHDVELARQNLANELIKLGAKVFSVELPILVDGKKAGLDDFMVWCTENGKDAPEELRALLKNAEPMELSAVAQCIADFNEKYMVVNEGGKVWVMSENRDDVTKRRYLERMKKHDFEFLYMNDKINTSVGAATPVYKSKAAVWLNHRDRRQYAGGVVFDPSTLESQDGKLNLWQGFAVDPIPGDWSLMKEHIQHVICSGIPSHFNYLMGWLAHLVQRPYQLAGVAIVIRGLKGTGKGTLANALVKIFGQHGLPISQSEHLVGHFNMHLRDCLFLFADEAFFAGDKRHVGVLNNLITEPIVMIEGKGQNTVPSVNRLHVMMASNNEWVVPSSTDERRHCVFNVSEARKGDHAYFNRLYAQLENGGHEAMLFDLLNYDLTGFEIRKVPETEGLQRQKELSLQTEAKWLMDVLYRGSLAGGEWQERVATRELFENYKTYAKDAKEYHPMNEVAFGRFMVSMGAVSKRFVPEGPKYGGAKKQVYGYELGALSDARTLFCQKTGLNVDWLTEDTVPEVPEDKTGK